MSEELEKVKNELLLNSFLESHLGEYSANLKANFIKECIFFIQTLKFHRAYHQRALLLFIFWL
nr:hypothetical protein [uncultured Campylobacter sp.]